MNLLITSSRMPFALDEIRKLGRHGHRVFAADTFRGAPGSHSRYVAARLLVASPQHAPARFIGDVKQIILDRRIELLIPCFEEVFYLARHLPELSEITQVFASAFDVLSLLHHKGKFNTLAHELKVDAPETLLVLSPSELALAVRQWPRFLARPACSRGGIDLFTNAGPLRGAVTLGDCDPTPARPWIVQPYIEGVDLCSFSIAQHGRVVAHSAYVHPMEIEHGGGIVFESVDEPGTLAAMQRVVEATRYHGQIGADFRRTPDGRLHVIECNPRPTAGVHLMDDQLFVEALLEPTRGPPRVVPPHVRRKYLSAVLRELLLHGVHLEDLPLLFAGDIGDVYGEPGDRMPSVYQAISYAYVLAYRARHARHGRAGTSLLAATFDGIEWNGEQIP